MHRIRMITAVYIYVFRESCYPLGPCMALQLQIDRTKDSKLSQAKNMNFSQPKNSLA